MTFPLWRLRYPTTSYAVSKSNYSPQDGRYQARGPSPRIDVAGPSSEAPARSICRRYPSIELLTQQYLNLNVTHTSRSRQSRSGRRANKVASGHKEAVPSAPRLLRRDAVGRTLEIRRGPPRSLSDRRAYSFASWRRSPRLSTDAMRGPWPRRRSLEMVGSPHTIDGLSFCQSMSDDDMFALSSTTAPAVLSRATATASSLPPGLVAFPGGRQAGDIHLIAVAPGVR
jgi:hypothetical protein